MALYTDLVSMKNYLPATVLLQVSDDSQTDQIDTEKINFAITQASDLIDSYLQGRYTLPLATVPAMISDICTKLTGYYLYKRVLPETLPDVLVDDYKFSMGILRDIQKGRISPFPVSANPVWMVSNKANPSAPTIPDRSYTPMAQATSNWGKYLV